MVTLLDLSPPEPVVSTFTGFPGGGSVEETWPSPGKVLLALVGEFDVFDRFRLLDLLSACILAGARHIEVDGERATFVDLAILRVLNRTRRYLGRSRGTLVIDGFRPAFGKVWAWICEHDMGGAQTANTAAPASRARAIVSSPATRQSTSSQWMRRAATVT